MPLMASRNQVAIKVEAVPGTAETLAAANVILTSGAPTWTPDAQMTDREALSKSYDHRGVVIGARMAKLAFKLFMRGTTGAPVDPTNLPDWVIPLRACGCLAVVSGAGPNEITTATPTTPATSVYVTLAMYRDGKQYLVHGAQGNAKWTYDIGAPAAIDFEFTGLYNTPTDVGLLSPTYPTVVEPPFLGASLSILGFATVKLKSLSFDLGNKIAMRPFPNTTVGYFTAQITGRDPSGTFDPEEELAATKNWFSEWAAGTSGSIQTGTWPSNGSNYNQFNHTFPNAQYKKVELGDRDGITTAPIDFMAKANSDAGDDSFSFVGT